MTFNIKDFEKPENKTKYTATPLEEKIIGFVKSRFSDMRIERGKIDKHWDTYQTMIDAIPKQYGDDRSSSTIPLASSMIELYVAEAIKIPTEFIFKSETTEYETQAKTLEYAWNYDRRKNNRKKVFNENEYTTAWFGFSVLQTGYCKEYSTQRDFDVDENDEVIWKKREIKQSRILVENVDIRSFYLDNQAKDIEDANDCIVRVQISYEEFKEYINNPVYKNCEYVQPSSYTLEYLPFTVPEDSNKKGDYVQIMKYWNVKKDMQIEIANGIVIREQHMLSTIDGIKALPFTTRVLGKKNGTYGGRGFCEALLMFNSEINDLRELLMDWIRKSNSPTIALGGGLEFDGRKFAFKNEILTFQWDLQNNFHQLAGDPPNQAIFSYLERIYKDIAMFTGIDIQSILGVAQQTAYQTNVQVEASQKRVNVWLMNRDLAFERFANLHKDNLQNWFAVKDDNGNYPRLAIMDEKLSTTEEQGAEGEVMQMQKYIPEKGNKDIIEVTPEMLKGEIYIDVFTNVNRPTSNIADRQAKLEFSTQLPAVMQGLAAAKQSGVSIDEKKYIEDLMEDYNITDVTKTEHQELKQQGADFLKQLSGMMSGWGTWTPQEEQWMPQPQWQPQEALSTPPQQAMPQESLSPSPMPVWQWF